MTWKRWVLGIAAGLGLLAVPIVAGCMLTKTSSPEQASAIAKAAAAKGIRTIFVQIDRPDQAFLNIAGCLTMGAAVIGLVLAFVRPGIISLWSVLGLAVTGIACWTLRDFLKDYLWLLKLVGSFGMILFGAAFAYGHRNWFERVTGWDADRDGDVGLEGSPNKPAPAPLPAGFNQRNDAEAGYHGPQ